ncbi:uncharacterized protein VNE69_01314 [Vairimorpha necatrix]|uniref:Uncharacterized protein n=1 Tax=Vairimorpha necatrix TaxID=6039 RepID=A0AAX4J8W0_9MICR
MKVFVLFLFIKANEELCVIIKEGILKRIETGDYVSCDIVKVKNCINIYACYNDKNQKIDISYQMLILDSKEEAGSFSVELADNYDKIIKKIEDFARAIFNDEEEYSYVFLYDKYDYRNIDNIKELIEQLKKINAIRRLSRKDTDIYYENICDKEDLLQKILSEFQFFKNETHTESNSSICFYSKLQKGKFFILFNIDVENKRHFFKFCIDELYYKVDVKVKRCSEIEKYLLRKLLYIYKLSCKNYLLSVYNDYELNIEFSTSCILQKDHFHDYTIEVENEKVFFDFFWIKDMYHVEKESSRNEKRRYISLNCYTEFQRIFSRLSDTNYIEGV